MKKALSLLLAVMMLASLLAACGGSGSTETKPAANAAGDPKADAAAPAEAPVIDFNEEPYEVSIQFISLFEENKDLEAVEAALNEITLEKINCTVDIVPLFIGDMGTTTSLGVAGDEKLDIVGVGLTTPMDSMVNDELLLPLDDLLAERGQGALAVTEHVAAAQKINGVTYAVSGYPYAAMAGGFVYNKTMADEYGIEMHDMMTMEEYTAVAEILKEHGVYFTSFGSGSTISYKFYNGGDYFGNNGSFGAILDPVNSTEIINPFDSPEFRTYYKTVKEWFDKGYTPADQLTDTTTVQEYFGQGKIFGTATNYTVNQITSWQSNDFEVGIVQNSEATISTSGAIEFMLGIAANCKRPDKAMDLINLIYSDPEVANLIQYGVEGLDYVQVEGTENVITFEGTNNADHNGYYTVFSHFGDPLSLKIVAPLTDSYYEDLKAFENSAKYSKTFGYFFDGTDYGAEAGAIASILEQKMPALNAGQVDDVDAYLDEMVEALNAAGMGDCIKANQEQLNSWLGQ